MSITEEILGAIKWYMCIKVNNQMSLIVASGTALLAYSATSLMDDIEPNRLQPVINNTFTDKLHSGLKIKNRCWNAQRRNSIGRLKEGKSYRSQL